MSKFYLLFLMFFCVAVSCREALVSSADAEKEKLLIGNWSYQTQPPDPPQTIQLAFDSSLTVQIANTARDSVETYRYHVEDGILYFLKKTAQGDAVQFFFTIIDLTQISLVLEFSDNGNTTIQVYTRI